MSFFSVHTPQCVYTIQSADANPVQIGREREDEIRPGYSGPLNKSVHGRNAQLRLGAQIQKTRDELEMATGTNPLGFAVPNPYP
jgi:hypothetical protein